MAEKQVIVQWFTPDEKHPPEGEIMVATVSGRCGHITYDHTFALVEWYDDGFGFSMSEDIKLDDMVVHAWADLEPYDVPKIWRK